ncbi:MAG: trehalose-phosphatase [Cuniculiplasma sp.]
MIEHDLLLALGKIRTGSQLFIDYDGTLVPIVMDPELCYADEGLKHILSSLDQKYMLYIVSGRTLEDLKRFIGLDLNYIYLHGMFADLKGKTIAIKKDAETYYDVFRKLESEVTFPEWSGVRIYHKPYGIVFHLGLVDPHRREGYVERIRNIAFLNHLDVYYGINLVELKVPGVEKGKAIRVVRNEKTCLIAGDEETDESGFNMCSECVTIHVGEGKTAARFTVKNIDAFREILNFLSHKPETS